MEMQGEEEEASMVSGSEGCVNEDVGDGQSISNGSLKIEIKIG